MLISEYRSEGFLADISTMRQNDLLAACLHNYFIILLKAIGDLTWKPEDCYNYLHLLHLITHILSSVPLDWFTENFPHSSKFLVTHQKSPPSSEQNTWNKKGYSQSVPDIPTTDRLSLWLQDCPFDDRFKKCSPGLYTRILSRSPIMRIRDPHDWIYQGSLSSHLQGRQ